MAGKWTMFKMPAAVCMWKKTFADRSASSELGTADSAEVADGLARDAADHGIRALAACAKIKQR